MCLACVAASEGHCRRVNSENILAFDLAIQWRGISVEALQRGSGHSREEQWVSLLSQIIWLVKADPRVIRQLVVLSCI